MFYQNVLLQHADIVMTAISQDKASNNIILIKTYITNLVLLLNIKIQINQ
jgi:hypothetical protein